MTVSITSVEARCLALPTGMRSFVLPNGHRTPTDLSVLMIRLTDSEHRVGQSLLWAQRESQLYVYEAGLRYLAEVMVGYPVAGLPGLVAALRSSAAFLGIQGAMAFAISGYEMALQDLLCRRDGVSLSHALGRKRDRVRVYETGLMLPGTIDELIEEAHAIYARGIRGIKMLVGRPTIEEDVERVAAVKEALPADTSLMVDALQRWTLEEAVDAAERLADLDLVWIEDPIDNTDLRAYAELVKRSPVPIATGETSFLMSTFEELLDAGVPYVVAELDRVGGIGEWMRAAGLVHGASAVILPHINPEVSAQLLAAVESEGSWLEHVGWFDALTAVPFDIANGSVAISDRPGTGFEPDPDAIERFARTPWLSLTS